MQIRKSDRTMWPNRGAVEEMQWYAADQPPMRLSGFAWFKEDRVFRRLPLVPEWPLREAVDALANATAGGQVQFQTDSRKLAVHVRLAATANMNHMPATGQCGFDLYLGPPRQQRFCNVTKYDHSKDEYEATLYELPSEMRNVTLNFPLYQGVEELRIGLDAGALIVAPPPFDDPRPVVVYGTSITQGGCAARPGMAYTNILSRRFNRPFVNLGFSGNGRGDLEVARLMTEISDPGCFLLDYEANAAAEERLQKSLADFIRILKTAHSMVPIVVLTRIRFAQDIFNSEAEQKRVELLEFQRQSVEQLSTEGMTDLHFIDGGELLGENFDECTVDGVHPTDFGFWRMAEAIAQLLEPILRISF